MCDRSMVLNHTCVLTHPSWPEDVGEVACRLLGRSLIWCQGAGPEGVGKGGREEGKAADGLRGRIAKCGKYGKSGTANGRVYSSRKGGGEGGRRVGISLPSHFISLHSPQLPVLHIVPSSWVLASIQCQARHQHLSGYLTYPTLARDMSAG